MYLLFIFIPICSSIILLNRYTGKELGLRLSISAQIGGVILSILILYEVLISRSPITINLGSWTEIIGLEWNLIFDSLNSGILLLIALISTLIQIYSKEYLSSDPHIIRFFSYLNIFTFSMYIVLTGENLLIIFMGWELVGITSYLLINYWYTRLLANMASLKAVFINKIGDWGFVIATILVFSLTDLSLSVIFSTVHYLDQNIILILSCFFILASASKSSQFTLHTWLISAMEGPTPVSALLHSSTMVILGVYFLIRLSPILEWAPNASLLIIWLGSLSALLGAASGLIENDIKKIIAFSTTSQLGYMFVACGISQYNLALLHLLLHAFFKSLLFLSAGAIIHAVSNNQDIRKMGSLILFLPITYSVNLLATLSLLAFPFFSGFYSKDLIIELLINPYNFSHSIAFIFTYFAALFTSLYSIRSFILVFLNQPNYPYLFNFFLADSPFNMTFPLILLSFGATYLGYILSPLLAQFNSDLFLNSIFIHPSNLILLENLLFPSIIPLFLLLLLVLIIPLSIKVDSTEKSIVHYLGILNYFNLYNHILMHNFFIVSNWIYRYWDKGLLEFIGPLGLIRSFSYFQFLLELISTKFLLHNLFIIIFSLVCFIALIF